ncbi:MAG: hypothetical protein KDI15_05835 [Thiothrix sp.]|nr:hypothetical protein [Thiothrix sp.]HPE59267.1 hypothetical protein [Thiolinea sp.]
MSILNPLPDVVKKMPKAMLAAGLILATIPVYAAAPATNQDTRLMTAAASSRAHPVRGMSMKQVRSRYGQPASTRISKGHARKRWPRITVWNYGTFSVYFEKSRVLHTVAH